MEAADTLRNLSTQFQINGHADYRIDFLSVVVFLLIWLIKEVHVGRMLGKFVDTFVSTKY